MARTPIHTIAPKVLKATINEHAAALDALELLDSGVVPSARVNMATAPTANDTVTIGGHVFKFVAALGAADTFTQVKIGTAAATRAAFVKAINGTVDAANVTPATVPFAGLVVADEIDTSRIRIRAAATRGGTPLTATAGTSVAVSEALTAAADVWDRANLNESGEAARRRFASTTIAITAAMIAAGKVYVEFPFTPTDVEITVRSAAGAPLPTTDAAVIEGNAVKITLAGGAAPALVATNVVTIQVEA